MARLFDGGRDRIIAIVRCTDRARARPAETERRVGRDFVDGLVDRGEGVFDNVGDFCRGLFGC